MRRIPRKRRPSNDVLPCVFTEVSYVARSEADDSKAIVALKQGRKSGQASESDGKLPSLLFNEVAGVRRSSGV